MHNLQSLKLFFVVNPISGGTTKGDCQAEIREYFKDKPHQVDFFLLTGKDDSVSVQQHIDTIKPDRVIAVGGDGTVKMLTELLKEKNLPLGIIPAGSANGMARELDIPSEIKEALDVIINGICQKIDAIRINEKELCIHISDIGLNAMLVKNFENSKGRGMWGYGKAVLRMLWEKQKMRVTIQTEKETVKRRAWMVALANARKYGTGANINPDGNHSDGLFEVVIVRKLNVWEIGKAIFTELSFHADKIEIIQVKNVQLDISRKSHFQIDGEYKGKVKTIQANMLPGAIHIMVPKEDN